MRSWIRTAALVGCGSLALTACGGGFGSGGKAQNESAHQSLRVMIATSTDAEGAAVKEAAASWAERTGNKVTVIPSQDLRQQLGQGFAGGNPPDVFYTTSEKFADYAEGGSLYPYGTQLEDVEAFSEDLRRSFSRGGKLVCAPKDSSTLALAINTELWRKAGLTEKDIPRDWTDLQRVARTLTRGKVTGLTFDPTYNRIGAFLRQSGGWITDSAQKKMTADTPANVRALTYVRGLLRSGALKYPKQIDSGWGGEAFGKGRAAMTIEGNWLVGGLKKDFPDTKYRVVALPEGPAGRGNLSFSTCWGVAKQSAHHKAAIDLVESLTAPRQQLEFADSFGVMPSRNDALKVYKERHPAQRAFVDGTRSARGPVTLAGFDKVLNQFDTGLESLASADPRKILAELQRNGSQALADEG
ncbi:sugar ABC transporter substrate-binding protein [Streptomyces purpurogeneiscleroticus]|uniref:sugar ABC transporter substrate-binding protein n=1 Tax=Streptomyces purpurogeneiscleroticus TaxID=68259 RepID=UPI001CBC6F34|nr:extracellular solute-binding protein [Streptomyces purpurogeneiscleroticus]MBZ4016075.1 ABC transporter substrate-binding protein [Streptomyces purpurogeneiscleroticus]